MDAGGGSDRELRRMSVRAIAVIGLVLSLLGMAAANATECPGNPYALGTSRVMTIDPAQHPRLGTVQYPETLPLEDKEVVLTFDDGPLPPYTNRDRKSTRLNSSHVSESRMPSSA